MKEHPIIFSTDMVKAILEGTKTMTGRVIKPKILDVYGEARQKAYGTPMQKHYELERPCPYGQVGDRLWVRETWRVESFMDGEPLLFGYKNGQTMEENEYGDTLDYESWYERVCIQSTEDAEKAFKLGLVRQDVGGIYHWDIGKSPCRWRPSIFMPRRVSRITLEITEVRVERVQEIIPEDILKEGVSSYYFSGIERTADFKVLWDSLNAKRGYGWEVNPWVWVISFRRQDNDQ